MMVLDYEAKKKAANLFGFCRKNSAKIPRIQKFFLILLLIVPLRKT